MSVTFKKVLRKDPFHKDGTGKYYPQLIVWGKSATLESIAVQMKESSSLTLGDIQSVITNFVGAMRRELFNGRSVNIDNFGVFSLRYSLFRHTRRPFADCGRTGGKSPLPWLPRYRLSLLHP